MISSENGTGMYMPVAPAYGGNGGSILPQRSQYLLGAAYPSLLRMLMQPKTMLP